MALSAQLGGSNAKDQQNNAMKTQEQIGNSQANFMQTLQQDFGTAFAGQQNILNGLTKSLTQTLNAGPSQFGFSQPETTALNTLATSGATSAYQQARAAAGAAAAASGGGANLPTGSQEATQAALAEQAGQNISNSLLGIQEAGYKQGVQNYNEAVSGLNTAASLENPSGIAGQANNAGEAAAGTAGTVYKEAQANNPMNQIGGIVGSIGGAALNAFLPGAGSLLGGLTSGLGSAAGSAANYARTFGTQAPQLGDLGGVAPPDLSWSQSTGLSPQPTNLLAGF